MALSTHHKGRVMQNRVLAVKGDDPHATVLDVRHTFKISTMGEFLHKIDADQLYLTATRRRYTTMSWVTVNITQKAWQSKHSRIMSTESPSFYMKTTFSKSLSNLMALLRPLRDRSYYVSRQILGTSTAFNKETLWSTRTRLHALSDVWRQPRHDNVTCAWSWRFCVITPAISILNLHTNTCAYRVKRQCSDWKLLFSNVSAYTENRHNTYSRVL